jgi:pimeloyl-ACP methyl ester carboxylesterase
VEGSWKSGIIRSGPVLLEYKVQARPGKPWLLFLHGYGQDYSAFQPVYDASGNDYSLLAIHLPHHGESRLERQVILSKEEWALCIEELLGRLETGPVRAIGFSMGAKFLLAAAEKKPALFNELILLAPDGLVMNPWYRHASATIAGRVFLRLSLHLFPVFRWIIALLAKLGPVRPALMRFAIAELSTREGRTRVLDVWLQFRKLWPDREFLLSQCKEQNIKVLVFLGRFDGILPLSRFSKIYKKEGWMNWEILHTGHAGLINAFARLDLLQIRL